MIIILTVGFDTPFKGGSNGDSIGVFNGLRLVENRLRVSNKAFCHVGIESMAKRDQANLIRSLWPNRAGPSMF